MNIENNTDLQKPELKDFGLSERDVKILTKYTSWFNWDKSNISIISFVFFSILCIVIFAINLLQGKVGETALGIFVTICTSAFWGYIVGLILASIFNYLFLPILYKVTKFLTKAILYFLGFNYNEKLLAFTSYNKALKTFEITNKVSQKIYSETLPIEKNNLLTTNEVVNPNEKLSIKQQPTFISQVINQTNLTTIKTDNQEIRKEFNALLQEVDELYFELTKTNLNKTATEIQTLCSLYVVKVSTLSKISKEIYIGQNNIDKITEYNKFADLYKTSANFELWVNLFIEINELEIIYKDFHKQFNNSLNHLFYFKPENNNRELFKIYSERAAINLHDFEKLPIKTENLTEKIEVIKSNLINKENELLIRLSEIVDNLYIIYLIIFPKSKKTENIENIAKDFPYIFNKSKEILLNDYKLLILKGYKYYEQISINKNSRVCFYFIRLSCGSVDNISDYCELLTDLEELDRFKAKFYKIKFTYALAMEFVKYLEKIKIIDKRNNKFNFNEFFSKVVPIWKHKQYAESRINEASKYVIFDLEILKNLTIKTEITPQESLSKTVLENTVSNVFETIKEVDNNTVLSNNNLLLQDIDKIEKKSVRKRVRNFIGKKVDYQAQNQRAKDIGYKGELLVLQYEKSILANILPTYLVNKISHTSAIEGDGTGYDIFSYTIDGKPKYIEVKTTTGGLETPFDLTINEIEFMKLHTDNYCLYRVYNYQEATNQAELYVLQGSKAFENYFQLEAKTYTAKLKHKIV